MWSNICARMPEPHIFDSVTAPADCGRPAPSVAWRAGAWPWPAIRQLPISTSSTASPVMPARSTAALIATLPSWCAASALKSPSMPPIGVRAAETMTMDSAMGEPPVSGSSRARGALPLRLEALLRFVREDIMHVAGQDFLLVALPECRIEQVGMVGEEHIAHRRIAEQEGREGLGKHVLRADAVPDLS